MEEPSPRFGGRPSPRGRGREEKTPSVCEDADTSPGSPGEERDSVSCGVLVCDWLCIVPPWLVYAGGGAGGIVVDRRGDWKRRVGRRGRFAHGFGSSNDKYNRHLRLFQILKTSMLFT